MGLWTDPRRYTPNALVYARMLEAAGFGHLEERVVLRRLLKEGVLAQQTGRGELIVELNWEREEKAFPDEVGDLFHPSG